MLNAYKSVIKLTLATEGDVTAITPYLIADPSQVGAQVDVIHDVTTAHEIKSALQRSCAALAG